MDFWKKALKERQAIVLATSSKDGRSRAIAVLSLGIIDNKILIGACLMKKTLENIKENNKVSIVANEDKHYFRIDGTASVYSSGKYLNLAISKSNPPLPKSAILVGISEVVDLETGKKII
ncbi:MAG: pyridoxamine 5'-phosphate oxidase family protein [Candidatus Levyibacteriota bacterium]